jgi:hypothetical protein
MRALKISQVVVGTSFVLFTNLLYADLTYFSLQPLSDLDTSIQQGTEANRDNHARGFGGDFSAKDIVPIPTLSGDSISCVQTGLPNKRLMATQAFGDMKQESYWYKFSNNCAFKVYLYLLVNNDWQSIWGADPGFVGYITANYDSFDPIHHAPSVLMACKNDIGRPYDAHNCQQPKASRR